MASWYLFAIASPCAETVNEGFAPGLLPKSRSQPNDNDGYVVGFRLPGHSSAGALLRTTPRTVQCSDLRADAVVEM
jgi:hypothetical protein